MESNRLKALLLSPPYNSISRKKDCSLFSILPIQLRVIMGHIETYYSYAFQVAHRLKQDYTPFHIVLCIPVPPIAIQIQIFYAFNHINLHIVGRVWASHHSARSSIQPNTRRNNQISILYKCDLE